LRSVPVALYSRSDAGGVDGAVTLLALAAESKGEGGTEAEISKVGAASFSTAIEDSAGAPLTSVGQDSFISGEDAAADCELSSLFGDSDGDSDITSATFVPSSSPSPSSSASLEESELSDSSLIASLTLSRISTRAREDATGRARRPRITA
jgi:hypothetical protein